MKKVIFLIFAVVGILHGQAKNTTPDSITVHRAAIDSNAAWHDTLATDVGTNTSNIASNTSNISTNTSNISSKLSLSGGTMTGSLRLGDLDTVSVGASNDFSFYHSGGNSFLKGGGSFYFHITDSNPFYFFTSGSVRWVLDASGNFYPSGNYDIGSETYDVDSLFVGDLKVSNNLIVGSTTVNATELGIIDGATTSTSELNILDGVTADATELNLLDGVTATTAELNYTDGVTSGIQTQIDTKLAKADVGDSIKADTRFFSVTVPYPTSSENSALFLCPYNITLQSVNAAVTGTASCSTDVNISWGVARNSADESLFAADRAVSSKTGESLTAYISGTGNIDTNDWIWITTSALNGTVYDLAITVTYIKR